MANAGGNSLLRIAANGDISTVAVFPSRPGRNTDAVLTAVVRGPDGACYVSELTGTPFAAGAANGVPRRTGIDSSGLPGRIQDCYRY